MKKFFVNILFLLIISLCFVGCKKSSDNNVIKQQEKSELDTKEIVKKFFSEFENSDYESMKNLCTQDFIDTYFHEGGVFGMVWARVTKIEEEATYLSEKEEGLLVDVEMKPSETSSFSSRDTSTSFYVFIKKQDDGSWLIDKFTTG